MARINDATVETFTSGGLRKKQAQVHALRLQGLTQAEIADQLDMPKGTVKSHANRVDEKAAYLLPHVSKIEPRARVTPEEDRAVVIWFENGAKLQYRVDDRGDVYEETFRADDPDSVYEQAAVPVAADELEEAALETLAMYINDYRTDMDALRTDWTPVYEAVTCLPA